MKGMTLMDKEAIVCERDYLKQENLEQKYNFIKKENRLLQDKSRLENQIKELSDKIKGFSDHEA